MAPPISSLGPSRLITRPVCSIFRQPSRQFHFARAYSISQSPTATSSGDITIDQAISQEGQSHREASSRISEIPDYESSPDWILPIRETPKKRLHSKSSAYFTSIVT